MYIIIWIVFNLHKNFIRSWIVDILSKQKETVGILFLLLDKFSFQSMGLPIMQLPRNAPTPSFTYI